MTEQIMEGLKQLAEKLGTTVEFLWSVMVRQQYIEPLYSAAGFVALVVISALVYKVYKVSDKHYRENIPCRGDTSVAEVLRTLGIVFTCICVVASLMFAVHAVLETIDLLNPEYAALKDITGQLRGGGCN